MEDDHRGGLFKRCRMHGGNSTGPRTPEGLARMRAARSTRGGVYGAAWQAFHRTIRETLRSGRAASQAAKAVRLAAAATACVPEQHDPMQSGATSLGLPDGALLRPPTLPLSDARGSRDLPADSHAPGGSHRRTWGWWRSRSAGRASRCGNGGVPARHAGLAAGPCAKRWDGHCLPRADAAPHPASTAISELPIRKTGSGCRGTRCGCCPAAGLIRVGNSRTQCTSSAGSWGAGRG